MTGPIPTELGAIPNLQGFRLDNNNLTGDLPTELANLFGFLTIELLGNSMQGDPWFLCDIANVTLDPDFTPDCFRYLCGDSEKEQCQIGDIRGATCLDIGCSASGT